MGRPGFLRVYFPLLGLLLVAPLALGEIKKGARRWVITFALFAACAGNICYLAPLVSNAKFFMRQVRKDIQNLPDEVLYTWGGPSFPYELAFPVLSNDPEPRKMKLDPLYLFTYAPFSVAWAEQKAGRGLIHRLCSPEGAPIITSDKRTFLLGSYCLDRLNGHLQTALVYKTPTIVIEQLRCVTTGVTSLKGTSPVTGQGVAQK